MAVTITDNRTDPTNGQADSTTGWTGSISPSLVTSNPNPVELTGSLGQVVSTTTQDLELGITSRDMSAGELVYVWVLANGIMDILANGGQGVMLSDGTDRIGYHLAGSDKAAFRHNSASVGWQCMLLDTTNLPASFTVRAGAEASLTLTAITAVGSMFTTLAKSVGGAVNCFTDIIRIGNGGLTITGGGTGTEGNFLEIATEDASDVSLKAYGICHELASNTFGLQGALTFGDNVGTGSVDFKDADATVLFEDRGIGTDKYKINIEGNTTGTTSFELGLKVGTVGGSNGCNLNCPVGVGAAFDASDVNVETVLLYGGQFTNYDQLFKFSADATNGPNHEIFAYTFVGCAQIDPGKVQFKNNTVASTVDANGGILLDADGAGAWSDLSFVSDGTGHAIYITATGSYTFNTFLYTGYGADTTTNAVVYNNSGGAVTITVSGGDTPTVRNGAGASTTVVSSVKYELTGLDAGADVTIVDITTPATPTELFNEVAGVDGIVTYNFNGTLSGTAIGVYLRNTAIENNEFDDVLPVADKSFSPSQTNDDVYI